MGTPEATIESMCRLTFIVCLLVSLLVSVEAGPCWAQPLQARASAIRGALDSRDFDLAEKLLRELQSEDKTSFAANNYDYLLARLLERRGYTAEASSLFLGNLERGSLLTQYSLWHLALIAQSEGNLTIERQYITRLLASFPSSALAPAARRRLIDNSVDRGDYRTAISLLRPILSTRTAAGRNGSSQLGDALLKTGDVPGARALFLELITGFSDDVALRACQALDSLGTRDASTLSNIDALRRARIYIANRHWPEARVHLTTIIERYPESPNRPEAIYQMGFTFYRQEKHEEAIAWFERCHSEFPSKKEGEEGYYYVASSLQKQGRYQDAIKRYQDFISDYPKSARIEGAYRNIVDCYRYAGRDGEATELSRRVETQFSGRGAAVVGLFDRARIALSLGNLDEAVALFSRLEAYQTSRKQVGGPLQGEAAFLRAYATEQLGRLAEASQLYLAITDQRDNYFGQRATERLQAMASTENGRRVLRPLFSLYATQARRAAEAARYVEAKDAANRALRLSETDVSRNEMLGVLRTCYARIPAYSPFLSLDLTPAARNVVQPGEEPHGLSHRDLAAELAFLCLYDEAAIELSLAGFGSAGREAAYSLAVYRNRGDHAHDAVSFAESALSDLPRDFRLELLARDLAELLYPAPYRDALNKVARATGVDPRLILSIARQESRFNPFAKSDASARGLLQFIPETARQFAEKEKITGFRIDDTYDPAVSIRLASSYLSDLFKLFPNLPLHVVASYNAGESNVARWMSRSRSKDGDRLVAEIPIPETKDYVAKVMNWYSAYRLLYRKDLQPVPTGETFRSAKR